MSSTNFHQNLNHLAATPPMGWNSFDSFGSSITEDEFIANVDFLAEHLLPHGWEYAIVDFCWSHPAPGAVSNPNLETAFGYLWPNLAMDEYGRLLPSPERFPSSKGGAGFKPLADYVHGKGLKFGIHVMRGIPRQAAARGLPVLGAAVTADSITKTENLCNWLNHMYGVDMRHPGAQEYYDSIFALYASWGVDYVKVDDMVFPYHTEEIEAVWNAAQRCGRPMVVSLSCGPAPTEKAAHLQSHSHLWRISADFWDEWELLGKHVELCSRWLEYSGPGHWADADMLPLGRIALRGPKGIPRQSCYTPDEQTMLMTLMAIFRSPLMFGGNLPDCDPFTLSLITNDEVIAVNQHSTHTRALSTKGDVVIWTSRADDQRAYYLAVFNLGDTPAHAEVELSELGLPYTVAVRDLWQRRECGESSTSITMDIPAHGSRLFSLTPVF